MACFYILKLYIAPKSEVNLISVIVSAEKVKCSKNYPYALSKSSRKKILTKMKITFHLYQPTDFLMGNFFFFIFCVVVNMFQTKISLMSENEVSFITALVLSE